MGEGVVTIGGVDMADGEGSDRWWDSAGGKLCELGAREGWLGRRGGGGAGARTLTRRLEERDRVESNEDRLSEESVSSW